VIVSLLIRIKGLEGTGGSVCGPCDRLSQAPFTEPKTSESLRVGVAIRSGQHASGQQVLVPAA